MGKSQRLKGKRGELRAVHLLQPVYPDARRSANQGAGAAQPDVDGTPYWVEAKEGRSIGLWKALEQALGDRATAGDDRPVLLVLHRTRGHTVVVMLADEFVMECLKR